jgi:hypothetical protein
MNKALQKRFLLFLIGCIGARFLFVYLAKIASLTFLKVMGIIALIISIGFISIYLFGLRKTGLETGGQIIWWNSLRPFHALTYAIFAYMALYGMQNHAWKVLLIDVIFGLAAFLIHHMHEFI